MLRKLRTQRDNQQWLHDVLMGKGLSKRHRRIAYIKEAGDGPWGDCEWTPTVKPGQAYF